MAGMLVQTGYNFLYGLWKYSWDADCELFLKILEEEIKEDVYTQQVQLQASLSLADMALPCHCGGASCHSCWCSRLAASHLFGRRSVDISRATFRLRYVGMLPSCQVRSCLARLCVGVG